MKFHDLISQCWEPDKSLVGFSSVMSRVPPEKPTWTEPADPEVTARQLREQLEAAKARMREHRETMKAAGLANLDKDDTAPS